MDFDMICRLCLMKGEKLASIFEPGSTFYDLIQNFTCLKVSRDDGLPTTLCMECISKLDLFKEFQDLCEQSDNILREYIQSKVANIEEEEMSRPFLNANINWDQEEISAFAKKIDDLPLQQDLNPLGELKEASVSSFRDENNVASEEDDYAWPGSISDAEHDESESVKNTEKEESSSEIKKRLRKKRATTCHMCEFCGRTFRKCSHLTEHELTHTKEKPFHCSYCKKGFWYKNSLIGHIKQNHTGDVNFTCEECGRGFFQKTEFERHRRTHSVDSPFKCNECDMSFKLLKYLKRHQKVHSGIRTHACQYCGKLFRMLQTLRVHLLLHTGEKPYKCEHCGRAFAQSAPLHAHIRTHTGEKPYTCNLCEEAFISTNALKTHMFKHTGVYPNSCMDCSMLFKRKKDLVDHWTKIHGGTTTDPIKVTPQLPHEDVINF